MNKAEFDEMAALVVRLRKDLELHTDALRQSNAQCSKLLVQNEQLTAELDRMKGDPLPIKLVGKLKDVETSNKTLHSELVEVRAALASVTEQRDSLRRTLDEWERADTKPHARIDEVAQTVPVCMQCLKERIKTAHAYETGPAVAILTKPLLPADVADHVVPPVLPLCNVCHECGSELANCSQGTNHHDCPRPLCPRTCTGRHGGGFSPYSGPCKSTTPVRHE